MPAPSYHDREMGILRLWESAVGLPRWQRDDALLAANGSPPTGLGVRNSVLLTIRGALFDRRWPLKSQCSACGSDCEFKADSVALAEELGRLTPPEISTAIVWAGQSLVLRAPTVDDLRAISHYQDSRDAMSALLARCLSGDLDLSDMDDEKIDELSRSLEALDPGAIVSFQLRCPTCDTEWPAVIDVGEAIWSELQHAAERSLIEVDALARAYGWTEDQVMGLSPTRRAAYLQLVGA